RLRALATEPYQRARVRGRARVHGPDASGRGILRDPAGCRAGAPVPPHGRHAGRGEPARQDRHDRRSVRALGVRDGGQRGDDRVLDPDQRDRVRGSGQVRGEPDRRASRLIRAARRARPRRGRDADGSLTLRRAGSTGVHGPGAAHPAAFSHYVRAARIIAALVLAFALAALAGWLLGIDALRQAAPGYAGMPPTSAIGFGIGSVAVLL